MGVTMLPAEDRVAVAWRNGGGVTREIAVYPGGVDDFRWRLSIADVGSDGPFSAFPGYRRVITVLTGAGMRLTVDGAVHDIGPLEPFEFDGGARTACTLPGGPITDLNLIVRAGDRGSVRIIDVTDQLTVTGPAAIVVVRGSVSVDGHPAVMPDAALVNRATVTALQPLGAASVALIDLP
ncbi:HutD/Ves family protein [Catellatospora sichuanensis]|uniref:HutD/Ves family protein n=1 Tax=Catellatospora sichuanensis TaxID=1969805 RepID=UPI001183DB80|nr:HutD family protein [Catellatospora sichuanensis]